MTMMNADTLNGADQANQNPAADEQDLNTNLNNSDDSQGTDDSESDSQQPAGKEDIQGKQKPDSIPYDRFKEVNEGKKAAEAQIKNLTSLLEAAKKNPELLNNIDLAKLTGGESSDQASAQPVSDLSTELIAIDKLFEGLPEPKFEQSFKNVGEVYKAFRRTMLAELNIIHKQNKANADTQVQKATKLLDALEQEVGEEGYKEFAEWWENVARHKPAYQKLSTAELIDIFKSDIYKAKDKTKQAPNPANSKINRSSKPANLSSEDRRPTFKDVSNKSATDILMEGLGNL